MSVAPSSSTTDGMDNELCIFLLKELDVKLDLVNSIKPVIGCVQNVNSLGTGFFFPFTDHIGVLSQPITGRRGMFT
jgi:hypothetical protein